MRSFRFGCVVLLAVSVLYADPASADEKSETTLIGRSIDNFTLQDFYGKEHSLSDYSDAKLVVVAFVGTECPLAKLYAPRLEAMSKEFGEQGAKFLCVKSNR